LLPIRRPSSPDDLRSMEAAPVAIYHATIKIISRSAGQSSIAAAAYRSASWINDERTGAKHDYSRKGNVTHSEIMAPEGAPAWAFDRARLWNAVEAAEKRKDSQLAREIEVALPRELTRDAGVELVRSFVREKCVDHGMVADFSIHEPEAGDGLNQPHAHIMLTMRRIDGDGFGKKATEWNPEFGKKDGKAYVADTSPLVNLREAWAEHVNLALERDELARGIEPGTWERVDHRSLEEQGIDREPTVHLGPQATAMEREGVVTRLGDHNRDVAERGAELEALRQERTQIEAEIIDLQAERDRRSGAALESQEAVAHQEQAERARQEEKQRQKAAQRAQEAQARRERELYQRTLEDAAVRYLRKQAEQHARGSRHRTGRNIR
jgi:ATP-dependent exoDNAse (exonuclease V) alpha subunit